MSYADNTQDVADRESFEKWLLDNGLIETKNGDKEQNLVWRAWKAALQCERKRIAAVGTD